MIRSGHSALTALLLMASVGCTYRDAQEQHIDAAEEAQLSVQAQAGDAEAAKGLAQIQRARASEPEQGADVSPTLSEYAWSADRLKNTISLAEKGDIAAVKALYDYYGYQGDREGIDRWEDWLVKRHDNQAMQILASKKFTQASDLSDFDKLKLAKLEEAESLMREVIAAKGPGDEPDVEFHQMIVAEIDRLNAFRATR